MKTQVEKQEKNVVKLSIEVPAQEAVDAYNRAVQRISQHINIAGFRRGKAPRPIVEQNVGKERIKYEALESMLPRIFQEVIKEHNYDIVTQPSVDSYDFNIGEDLKISATIELRPEVKLGTYKGMTVKVESEKIPEDAFDKAIESMKKQSITTEIVVDRPSSETDFVTFDFEGFVNGEAIKNGSGKNYTLDIANSSFIPGFAEQLVGHSTGEEFDIEVKFPENYHEENLAGAPAVFKIKLHEIKQKIEPELNDEFAKKVGPFETMEDLKADIQKYLEKTRDDKNKEKADEAIFEKVLENTELEIPDSMIERECDHLLEEYKQKLVMQGFTYEQALQQYGEDSIMEQLKEDAVKRIKNSLVIDKIASEENLTVQADDMEAKLAKMQAAYQMDKTALMRQLSQNPGFLSSLSQQVINEKVSEFLAANNTVEFTD